MTLKPFADDAASTSIGGLTIENGTARVALYGSLDITADRAGLAQAHALQALVNAIVGHLEQQTALPDGPPPTPPVRTVKNPFG